MRPFLLAGVLLSIALAGCSDDGADKTPITTPPATSAPRTSTGSSSTSVAPPVPASGAAFDMDTPYCVELLIIVPITMAQARTVVPAGYTPVADALGMAAGFGGLKVCDSVTLGGTDVGQASTSDVGVLVESPDGSEGTHYYQAWWLTDNQALANRLTAQGWRGGFVNGTTIEVSLSQGAGTAAVTVPWDEGAYSVAAHVVAEPLPPAGDYIGWHDGPNGTVTVRKTLTSSLIGGGPGDLTAAGPMADLLGPSASGPSVFNVYSMTSQVGPAA